MEHLTKNTYNEKLIVALQEIRYNTETQLAHKFDSLINKIENIGIAIFSSLTAALLANICYESYKEWWFSIIIFIFVFFISFLCASWVIKKYLVRFDYIDLEEDSEVELIKKFNTEIIQKVAEINEAVSVAHMTPLGECCVLNVLVSIYNLNDVMIFIDEKICNAVDCQVLIRKEENLSISRICSKRINIYALSSISFTLEIVNKKMKDLMESNIIKELKGYSLLYDDYVSISEKINNLTKYIDEFDEKAAS